MSGKLICADRIFVQKTSLYVECVGGTLQFAKMPVCFDGTWLAGSTVTFTLSIQKKVDVRCNLFNLEPEEITITAYDKISGMQIATSSPQFFSDNPGMYINYFELNNTGDNICSFYILVEGNLKDIPSLCVVGNSFCSNICASVSASSQPLIPVVDPGIIIF